MVTSEADAAPAHHVMDLTGLAHGGEAVGRLPSGKACFVPFAIPGERVRVEVVEERRRWARARLVEVIEASDDRVAPPCPYFGPEEPGGPPRCGGCAFQHVALPRQAVMKARVVREQLERIGGLADPPVADTVAVAAYGYRQRTRFAVTGDGRLGYHRLRSDDALPIDVCILLDGATQRQREAAGDSWAGVEEVEVHTGHDSEMLIVHPGPGGLPSLPDGDTPVAVTGAGSWAALRGEPAVVHRVAGFELRVSATSFFQPSAAGAEALVRLVREAAEVASGDRVCDLYAGVGLFARVLAADGAQVTAVEAHRQSAADARANLAEVEDAVVVTAGVEAAVAEWVDASRTFDVIVADPPRRGAGPDLCRRLRDLAPRCVVYISCDPAALARDARALADVGLHLRIATPVDQFAQTATIETVAVFGPGRP